MIIGEYKFRRNSIFAELTEKEIVVQQYIMTGQDILIEKSKFEMASEDIATMYELIRNPHQ